MKNHYHNFTRFLLLKLFFFAALGVTCAKDYEPFVVEKLGNTIYNGVFTGNGLLGTMTYLQSDSAIKIGVGRTDVYDHRKEDLPPLFANARLPIGFFSVQLTTAIDSARGIISISDAKAVATIYTAKGVLKIQTTTLSEKNYMLIEIDRSEFSGQYTLHFVPELSQSPRRNATWIKQPENYHPNPPPIPGQNKMVHFVHQKMLAGGGYVTAFKTVPYQNRELTVATIRYSQSNSDDLLQAIADIKAFRIDSLAGFLAAHTAWWKTYMDLSRYEIPDERLQKFYDLQMYKLGCLTRSDKPAIDLQGPWTGAPTPWPAYWFNLNIQLTYSPLYTANRLQIATSLIRMFNDNKENLKQNILPEYRSDSYGLGRNGSPCLITDPIRLQRGDTTTLSQGQAELSNLTWVMLYYYQHYRYSMDSTLKKPLYELLKGSVNFAIHFIDKDKNGKYQFVVRTHSPEYPAANDVNTNYDLSALRWGIKTLLELGQHPEMAGETAYLNQLKNIQAGLIDYPQDENGFWISTHQPYARSHRHYSHLMMIYPYYLVTPDQPENISLIKKSVRHWQSKPEALQGYSLSGAASIYALLGEGDTAISYMQKLNERFIQPNTLYKETGPVIETPLALAASLQELSLQFWKGTVRVFPAIPSSWKNVSFRDFRTDGAFLISAEKRSGLTRKIEVFSEHGGTIRLLSDELMKKIAIEGGGKLIRQEGRLYELDLPKGAKAVMYNE